MAVDPGALRRHQREIDELNVFPVPDGDTGTNLVLTVASAHEALAAEPDGADGGVDGPAGTGAANPGEMTRLGRVLGCMARGALLGARGNSGVIMSQLLRGLADALAAAPHARGRAVAAALGGAATAAYAAVADPVEGTLLSVARGAADGAARADSDELAAVVSAAAAGAAAALALTPSQLPALARAGVVDAGGRGLVVLLEALVEVVTGVAVATAPLAAMARDPRLLEVTREAGSAGYAYEVQYLLDAAVDRVDRLRTVLAGLGDSLVIVGTGTPVGGADPTWNVHVHVNDVGAALEAGVEAGRPHRISVTRFADQPGPAPYPADPPAAAAVPDPDARGYVVVAPGQGLAALFAGEGAVVVGGTAPSTGELLAAVAATGARDVVLLPDDVNSHGVAALAAAQALGRGLRVGVVPTRSPVQALAALAVRDPGRRFEDDVLAMTEAAGACRYAAVAPASRAAQTAAGPCRPGDLLGLVDGEVHLIGADLAVLAGDLLDRLLAGGGELVTLLLGRDAPAGLGADLAGYLGRAWPGVEVALYDAGQPVYPLLVGIE